ncbi:MAG: DUF4397 domain-containing protein, partial [Pseudomonadota bacterium]
MLRSKLTAMAAVAAIALTGCDAFDDDDDDAAVVVDTTVVRVLHASPDAPAVDVTIDGLSFSGVDYKQGTQDIRVPGGTYTVQVDGLTPGGNTTVIGPVDLALAADTRYAVIAAGPVATIAPVIVEIPDQSPAVGNIRATVVHGAPAAPAVDVYVTAPGAALGASAALGSFSFGDSLGPVEVPGGEYQIRVTLAGTTTVVFDSGPVVLTAGIDYLITAVENTE